ncbi:hypothetical protein QNH23_00030 [Siminovitchia fortis]|uniref:Transposase n=1 Tax=Siminovitchia fortis TaxID=254758 RepID=A0A443IUV5_9BACI|nr:hypothetical protein [Siminovitchia fortis]RWR11863.1 hypothetical protein D4N35_007955 [Siminovitchia fortis]WHY81857.1 hypothetical protein QNH23_00030 [Siminovitchia fortis]
MEKSEKQPFENEIMELPISYEEKGKAIGREEGRMEGKKEIALQMLQKGLSIDLIVEITQLDKEEIEKLRDKL